MLRNNQNNLHTLFIGQNYIYLPETRSTNLSLKLLLDDNSIPEGTVISAGYQTHGKGQTGAVWESNKEQNITLSILLYPKFLNPGSQFEISKAIALAVHDFIISFIENETVKIKWPNDILVSGQKICGILIENGLNGDKIGYCIAGIGINVNEIFTDPHRTSLKTISGLEYDLRYLEKILFSCIEKRYLQLRNNPVSIANNYLDTLFGYKERMKFKDILSSLEFEGVIIGIKPDGRLEIETEFGIRIFNTKEVAFSNYNTHF